MTQNTLLLDLQVLRDSILSLKSQMDQMESRMGRLGDEIKEIGGMLYGEEVGEDAVQGEEEKG